MIAHHKSICQCRRLKVFDFIMQKKLWCKFAAFNFQLCEHILLWYCTRITIPGYLSLSLSHLWKYFVHSVQDDYTLVICVYEKTSIDFPIGIWRLSRGLRLQIYSILLSCRIIRSVTSSDITFCLFDCIPNKQRNSLYHYLVIKLYDVHIRKWIFKCILKEQNTHLYYLFFYFISF